MNEKKAAVLPLQAVHLERFHLKVFLTLLLDIRNIVMAIIFS